MKFIDIDVGFQSRNLTEKREFRDVIVIPIFGNDFKTQDVEALAKLKEVFPNKTIETINYYDIVLKGGLLNCTTWVVNQIGGRGFQSSGN